MAYILPLSLSTGLCNECHFMCKFIRFLICLFGETSCVSVNVRCDIYVFNYMLHLYTFACCGYVLVPFGRCPTAQVASCQIPVTPRSETGCAPGRHGQAVAAKPPAALAAMKID